MSFTRLFILAVVVVAFVLLVNASDANDWLYPTNAGPSNYFAPDLVFSLGSQQTLQWTTNISDEYAISLFQQDFRTSNGANIGTVCTMPEGSTGSQSFHWTVQVYSSDLSSSPVYFLWVDVDNGGFTSHYFNITTDSATSSSGSSLPSTSPIRGHLAATSTVSSSSTTTNIATSSTKAAASTTTTNNTLSTAKPSPTATQSSSDNTAVVKVGLGVGIGIGVPSVLIAGIWIGISAVKQRRGASPRPSGEQRTDHDHSWSACRYEPGQHPTGDESKGLYEAPEENMHQGLHEASGKPILPAELQGKPI